MKIVLIVDYSDVNRLLVQTVLLQWPISLVIVQQPHTAKSPAARVRCLGETLFSRITGFSFAHEKHSHVWRTSIPNTPVLFVKNLAELSVFSALEKIKPDILITHTVGLLPMIIAHQARLALNIHEGLAPYYRGSMCIEQALLQGDIRNIGVTLHKIAAAVDAGDILIQGRIRIQAQDTLSQIYDKVIAVETKLLLDALRAVAKGQGLTFFPQDLTQGKNYTFASWSQSQQELLASIKDFSQFDYVPELPIQEELIFT